MIETGTYKQDYELDAENNQLYLREAVLKVHSRCNLNCDYCYVYNLGDESWREQPRIMSPKTVETFASRLGEYLNPNPPLSFTVVFHGGEPLLAPPSFYEHAIDAMHDAVTPDTVLNFEMQTNGALLNAEYLDTFRLYRVALGISLDGDREAQDRHRLTRGGKSSFDDTMNNITLLTKDDRYNHLFRGILAVVDLENDPVETYRFFRDIYPPSIDFLLPHGNWSIPPPGLETTEKRQSAPYAKWLGAAFDEWFPDDTEKIRIRTFDSIIHMLSGGHSEVESIGGEGDGGLVVVETDGSYELVDTLKATPGNVAKTGKNIYRHSLEEAAEFMNKKAKLLGAAALSKTCMECPLVVPCGGGYAPHRFHTTRGFANRSVYCQDLANTILHVNGRLTDMAEQYVPSPYQGYTALS